MSEKNAIHRLSPSVDAVATRPPSLPHACYREQNGALWSGNADICIIDRVGPNKLHLFYARNNTEALKARPTVEVNVMLVGSRWF